MSELLFFVLGLVIGGLSGTFIMCAIYINKLNELARLRYNRFNNCIDSETCEEEK